MVDGGHLQHGSRVFGAKPVGGEDPLGVRLEVAVRLRVRGAHESDVAWVEVDHTLVHGDEHGHCGLSFYRAGKDIFFFFLRIKI